MIELLLLKGLPGCGKTQFSKSLIASSPNKYKRINKDDLREMLDNSKHSKSSEQFVLDVRDTLIMMAIASGKHPIIDDTNLNPRHEQRIRELIKGKATLRVIDMTDVPPDICIYRDAQRAKPVGAKVIKRMYNQYLRKEPIEMIQDKSRPKAIIVDIDGTVAKMNGRTPYEYDKVDTDILHKNIAQIISVFYWAGFAIIFVSGRDEVCREKTNQWLVSHFNFPYELWMRPKDDSRMDAIVKKEIFDNHIQDRFYIHAVLDDRDQVVDMWRSMGLICLQVAEGSF